MLSSLLVLLSTTGLTLAHVTPTTTKEYIDLIFLESSTATREQTNSVYFAIHGWLLWVTWGIFTLVQISATRYLKTQWRYSVWIHGISGFTIMILTIGLSLRAGGRSKGIQKSRFA
jgi:hypothetical protein